MGRREFLVNKFLTKILKKIYANPRDNMTVCCRVTLQQPNAPYVSSVPFAYVYISCCSFFVHLRLFLFLFLRERAAILLFVGVTEECHLPQFSILL